MTGIDVSEVQIQRARHLVPAATFLRADATAVELPSESSDAVVALYSLIHMPVSAQPALLRAIAGWLAVDGLLLLSAGWGAWTGSETGWLGEAGFQVVTEEFVPEGTSGHSLFWARRTALRP